MIAQDLARTAVIPRRTAPGIGGPVARHAEAPARRAAGRNLSAVRRLLSLGSAGLIAVMASTACSGSQHAGSGSTPSAPNSTVATRWWSDNAADKGSTISLGDPTAAAGKLHPDRREYCTMLQQTVAAGKSILPGVTRADPRLLASTEAFVSELQQVAPSQVSKQWKLLGDALVEFVKSQGQSLGSVTTQQMAVAAQVISTDASQQCHVNVAASPTATR